VYRQQNSMACSLPVNHSGRSNRGHRAITAANLCVRLVFMNHNAGAAWRSAPGRSGRHYRAVLVLSLIAACQQALWLGPNSVAVAVVEVCWPLSSGKPCMLLLSSVCDA
jgi:hypothetical protein